MASESGLPTLQQKEASTGEEGALEWKAPTDGLEACATERKAEDGCSMGDDEAEEAKKAGLSEVLDRRGDATVVADKMTDEEEEEEDEDDAYCPFDQVDHVDGKMMEDEDEDDVDFPSDVFNAEFRARFLDQVADARTVADELTDEEDDDVYSPFDYAFLAEFDARHEEEFQELLAEKMMI